jgi:hypothetical protein
MGSGRLETSLQQLDIPEFDVWPPDVFSAKLGAPSINRTIQGNLA